MYYVLRIGSVVLLAAAAVWSVMLARADAAFREGTPEGVARAAEQMPGNTSYLALEALQADYDGRDSTALLERIAQLNPTGSAARIRLGLAAEQRGDVALAERWLREAYAVDHQFEPRWTLANFFFRQKRTDEFWTWIRSALEISYGDRRPAFDLCWAMSSDGAEILSRAIPDREEVGADYLVYVMDRPAALAAAAKKVHRQELLWDATDRLLDARRYSDAVQVWQLTGRPAPDGVTAPDFEPPQTGRGFDWRWTNAPGVKHRSRARIQLSGEQPESVELLHQYVGGLRRGERYRLEWKMSAEVPGIAWRIDGKPATEFRADTEVVRLSLWYQRPLGEVRSEGAFELSGVKFLLLH
jgi:tetratricopeptide (TPR) repeat protein